MAVRWLSLFLQAIKHRKWLVSFEMCLLWFALCYFRKSFSPDSSANPHVAFKRCISVLAVSPLIPSLCYWCNSHCRSHCGTSILKLLQGVRRSNIISSLTKRSWCCAVGFSARPPIWVQNGLFDVQIILIVPTWPSWPPIQGEMWSECLYLLTLTLCVKTK